MTVYPPKAKSYSFIFENILSMDASQIVFSYPGGGGTDFFYVQSYIDNRGLMYTDQHISLDPFFTLHLTSGSKGLH